MKSFYEQSRERCGLLIETDRDFSYPAHYHANLEILVLQKGEYTATVNDLEYALKGGCVLFVDNYDIHAYRRVAQRHDEKGYIIIIPYAYLQRFNLWRKGLAVGESLIEDEGLCERLTRIIEEYLYRETDENIVDAGVDLFLATLYSKLTFVERKSKEEVELMRKILAYLHENFRGNVTRKELARVFGYTETHVSKVFHRYIPKGISAYVNELRIAYIEKRRREGDSRLTFALIYEAGFKSERTYYRSRAKK